MVQGALGDPTRILILNLLATETQPMNVGEIVAALDVGQSTISHHLQILGESAFRPRRTERDVELVADQRALPARLSKCCRTRHGSPPDHCAGNDDAVFAHIDMSTHSVTHERCCTH